VLGSTAESFALGSSTTLANGQIALRHVVSTTNQSYHLGVNSPRTHVQDQNAGNIGDLLKHFHLIELIHNVLRRSDPLKVAYLESHAGARRYAIDQVRIADIARNKKYVCDTASKWALFDRLNSKVADGIYVGSFGLAIQLLTSWKQTHCGRSLKVYLWEKDAAVRTRIQHYICEHQFTSILDKYCLGAESNPSDFESAIARLCRNGWAVIWLCDPYWGRFKAADRSWFRLLDRSAHPTAESYGLLFTVLGGNSNLKGPDKFDYERSLGAPSAPLLRIDKGIRSYGLYCAGGASGHLDLRSKT
jgi:hypothetical protein